MIDYFSLALTHGLIILALVRLLTRADLDREEPMAAEPAVPPEDADHAPTGGAAQRRRARRARRRNTGASDA